MGFETWTVWSHSIAHGIYLGTSWTERRTKPISASLLITMSQKSSPKSVFNMTEGSTMASKIASVPPMPSLTSHPPHIHQQSAGPVISRQGGSPTPPPIIVPIPSGTSSSSQSPETPSPPAYGQQEYSCPNCNQVYKKIGHLNRHALTHAGKRFPCEVEGCDKTFSRMDNMRTQ
jgi:hypothetical protein